METDKDVGLMATNSTRLGWVSEPSYRGTLSILISCVSTLLLCSLSVMHLSIPRRDSSMPRDVRKYLYWTLIGIFGPELVIWAAWRQFLSAKALQLEISRLQLEGKIANSSDRHPWTITHGFYAAMGGFVIDLDTKPLRGDSIFTEKTSRLALTPKGVRLLADCGYLPNVSLEEIADKSKTDELGKLLACIQAVWMVVQVCCRLWLKLPITLLEVTTLGHVLCALILYMLWWHKPRWIREPTKIEGEWLRPISAFMLMASQMSDTEAMRSVFGSRFDVRSSEISKLYFMEDAEVDKKLTFQAAVTQDSNHISGLSNRTQREKLSPKPPGVFIARPAGNVANRGGLYDVEAAVPDIQGDDDTTAVRRELAAVAITEYPAIRSLLHQERAPSERKYYDAIKMYPEMPQKFRRKQCHLSEQAEAHLVCETEHLVAPKASDWPSDGLLRTSTRTTGGLVIGCFLWCASIAFAAVHISAWRDEFPSTFEAWTWRASSTYIGFSGIVWLIIHILAELSATIWWFWFDLLSDDASRHVKYLFIGVCSMFGILYVFSRIFLIVEAFVSLRSLPRAAFLVPEWTVSVPHL